MTTEDVAERCSSLALNAEQQLIEGEVSTNICVQDPEQRLGDLLDSSIYINSNMLPQIPSSKDSTCAIYTAAIPADFAGSFPEGTVLQILPESALLTVASVKSSSNINSSSNTLVFKDSSFSMEIGNSNSLLEQSVLTMSNLTVELAEQVTAAAEVAGNSEGNISDIDLSFLTETEDSAAISDARNINENASSEFQESLSNSMQILQNNLSLIPEENKIHETDKAASELSKDAEDSESNVVMIDVTNPIQLSQNSLIVVNGQKCVLQHDAQSGLVVAYPVKEPEKLKRRRGRPRKNASENPECASEPADPPEMERTSDADVEKGLLEIVNDDGALVRRSSRKRKVARILRDYETGNLKQELGSDVEDIDVPDRDCDSKKKKSKCPGRPRKYELPQPVENPLQEQINTGIKRRRGRPRKYVAETEPTQAFLVQTADGKNLMMHMPLSSIPPGVTLQEVAQDIANKLNLGVNQTEEKGTHAESSAVSSDRTTTLGEQSETPTEPAVQDHSVGSTTMITSKVMQVECENSNGVENIADSTSQEVTISSSETNVCDIINSTENKETLSENTAVPQNICEGVSLFMSEMSNVPKNDSGEKNVSISKTGSQELCFSHPDNTSNSFCLNDKTKGQVSIEEALKSLSSGENLSGIECNTLELSSEYFISDDLLKDKVSLILSPPHPVCSTASTNMYTEKVTLNCTTQNETKHKGDSESVSLEFSSTVRSFAQTANSDFQNLGDEFHHVSEKLNINKLEKNTEKQMTNIILCNKNSCQELKCNDFDNSSLLGNSADKKQSCPSDSVSILQSNKVAQFSTMLLEQISDKGNTVGEVRRKRGRPRKKVFDNSNVKTNTLQGMISIPKMTSLLPSSASSYRASTSSVVLSDKMLPILLPKPEATGMLHHCKCCQFPFSTKEELIEHFKEKHPRCICNICNHMAEHPYTIKRHSHRHSGDTCFCHICKKVYKDHYILKMHIKMVHTPADVLFYCQVCAKKFNRKAHLKRHLRTHDPDKPYKCHHCEYRGCEKSDITKHIVIHEDPKHQCEICSKTFRHIKNKELHIKRHKGQRDYKCGICDFYGYTFTDIRKHIERKHTNSKFIICETCGQACKTLESLEEHQNSLQCQSNALQQKVSTCENAEKEEDCIHLRLVEDMPINILEEQEESVTATYDATTLPVMQNGRLVVDGIISSHGGQIVVNGLEGCEILSTENFSLVTTEVDSNKEVTVTTAGKGETKLTDASLMSNLSMDYLQNELPKDHCTAPDMFSLCSIEAEVSTNHDIQCSTSS